MAPVPGRRLPQNAWHHSSSRSLRRGSVASRGLSSRAAGRPVMSAAHATTGDLQVSSFTGTKWCARRAARAENILVSLALGIMVVLPLAEAALRRTLHVSIPASISIVQHMVLIVGMLGGAIAAREKRLVCLSNFAESKLRCRFKIISVFITWVISALSYVDLCFSAF